MKRFLWMGVVALGMATTSFAGNKVESKDWNMTINMNKLTQFLDLDGVQVQEVTDISEFFTGGVQSASYAKKGKQAKKLREAVYGNMKLMKRTLTNEQYRKYIHLVNVTLRNKGLDVYMSEEVSE